MASFEFYVMYVQYIPYLSHISAVSCRVDASQCWISESNTNFHIWQFKTNLYTVYLKHIFGIFCTTISCYLWADMEYMLTPIYKMCHMLTLAYLYCGWEWLIMFSLHNPWCKEHPQHQSLHFISTECFLCSAEEPRLKVYHLICNLQ